MKTKQLFPVNELEFLITKHTNDGKFDDEFGDLSGYKILSFEEVTLRFKENKKQLRGIQKAKLNLT